MRFTYTISFTVEDVDVVPLVGVYSTEAHPFGLVYEYMEGLRPQAVPEE
jgi:hypothetical protein